MKQNGARNKTNAGKANKDKDEMEQQEEEEYLDANYYYRSRSEQVSKNIVDHELQTHSSNNSDVTSFEQLQYESNMRKLKNDYKVREGDYIYRKYFTDDSIDPEIKELWESRKNNNNKMVIEKVQQQKQQNRNDDSKCIMVKVLMTLCVYLIQLLIKSNMFSIIILIEDIHGKQEQIKMLLNYKDLKSIDRRN